MDTSKKVSVIVPVFHVEQYLHQCIDSIIKQTYPNIEIILVDDGGDDACPLICEEYAEKSDAVKVIHKGNGGLTSARRAGVDACSGEYILFVDGDDWLNPCTIATCMLEQSSEPDIVCFSYNRVYQDKEIATPVIVGYDRAVFDGDKLRNIQRRIIGLVGDELKHIEAADRLVTMWGKLYKADIVKNGRWFSERVVGPAEDLLFNLYAFYNCQKILYINKPLYYYRRSVNGSLTAKYRDDLADKRILVFDEIREFIHHHSCPPGFFEALQNRIVTSMVGLGMCELAAPKSFFQKAKYLRSILNKSPWKDAYQNIPLTFFSFKWKLFFACCKYRQTEALLLLLYAMRWLRSRVTV